MNELWIAIEPYVMQILGIVASAGGAGTIIYFIVRRLIDRFSRQTNETFNADKVANKVVARIGGKSLKVDVAAVTERALKELRKEIATHGETIGQYRHILALMGGALAHLKSLSDQEKEELLNAVKVLDKNYDPTPPIEPVLLKLEVPEKEPEQHYID